MKEKIQITGLTGFVGGNLEPYLADLGFDVQALNLRDDDYEINGDVIIHLAGKAHDLKKSADKEEYYKVNFELTKKLYSRFLESNATKFIFLSSVKASRDNTDELLTESVIPDPRTDYGKSKLLAEEYIKEQYLPADKSYYIIRPCMIHGPGNKGNLNLLYKFVKKNIPYPLSSFENRRSFLSIENLCFVVAELIRQNVPSDTYQLADDDPLSTNEVIAVLADALNQKPKFWFLPARIVVFFAKIGDLMGFPANTERLHKLTENFTVSNAKIKQALGVELPLASKEGLFITAKSFTAK